jgi:hypothetical protein
MDAILFFHLTLQGLFSQLPVAQLIFPNTNYPKNLTKPISQMAFSPNFAVYFKPVIASNMLFGYHLVALEMCLSSNAF